MEIYAYRCRKCGHVHYPYRMVCKNCRENEHDEFDPVPLPKKGKLLTFTHLYNLPADYMVARLSLGIVELDNGIRVIGQIAARDPRIGMELTGKVEIVRSGEYDRHFGMVFYES
jgi:uncharacterized OB-fold protein